MDDKINERLIARSTVIYTILTACTFLFSIYTFYINKKSEDRITELNKTVIFLKRELTVSINNNNDIIYKLNKLETNINNTSYTEKKKITNVVKDPVLYNTGTINTENGGFITVIGKNEKSK